ncbi:MAG: T9SS type A sorting domain-containing protein [Bacteroidetes bacterium]|nr:T9SS type A sorting domain-containing protein [Bacteroidota bacterium]
MRYFTLFTALSAALGATAQEADSIYLGAQYMNESYYSFENGEIQNVNNLNWDLAFDLSPYGAAVRFNRKTDLLFVYPGSSADWNTLDTTGHSSWDQFNNGYSSWSEGALNAAANIADPVDLGWGTYNSITHITEGSRIFVVKLDDDSYRKLFIEELASGVYTFKYAMIDGTNELTETITKSDYAGKNFIHYSLLNEAVVDREPASADWDIVFTNYVLELAPGYFSGVTGVLANSTFRDVYFSESNNVPVADANYTANPFNSEIDIVGYNWKTFNNITYTYDLVDSLCYFFKDENNAVWKLVFTGFAGSSTGKIVFTKEQVAFAGLAELPEQKMNLYPQPANTEVLIQLPGQQIRTVAFYALSGELITVHSNTENNQQAIVPVNHLNSGVYIIQITTETGDIVNHKLVINH